MAEETNPPDRPPHSEEHPPEGLLHPEIRTEPTDARFNWIFGIIIASAVMSVIILASVWGLFYHYRAYEAAIKRSQFPLAPSGNRPLPPQPRLEQINRMGGIEKGNVYRREERKEAILDSYGSADDGYVHIPIDRAMEYIAGKLPARAAQPSAERARRQNGLVNAGASNSGRMFRGNHE
jgi:hypothetical protein